MLTIIRVTIVLAMPALLWLGWSIDPDLIGGANMRYLAAVFLALWGVAFHFLHKSADLSGLPGLSGREQERIVWKLTEIRRRVWFIGVFVVVSTFLVWFFGSVPVLSSSIAGPLVIGLLVGLGISYLLAIPGWFSELYAFSDAIRLREDKKKRAEAALKQIGDHKKDKKKLPKDTATA